MGWSKFARKGIRHGLESCGVDPETAKWIGWGVSIVIMVKTFDFVSAAEDAAGAFSDVAEEAGSSVTESPAYSSNAQQTTFGSGWDRPAPIVNVGPKPEML